jgi:hypothetical protein
VHGKDVKSNGMQKEKKWCDKHKLLVLQQYRKKYYQNNKAAFKRRQTEWNLVNREQYLKQQQGYRDKNREIINEKARKYYHARKQERINKYSLSKEYIKAKNLKHYRENRDAILAKRRERWHKTKDLNKG